MRGLALCGILLILLGSVGLAITFKWNGVNLIATVAQALYSPPVLVSLDSTDGTNTFAVGETKTVNFDVDASVPVNSLGATIDYPKDMLEVVALSKENSFINLWTQDTVIKEATGEISFSGGSTHPGGVTGTSTVLTITVRATHEGPATISVGHVEVYAADGKGTMVDTGDRPISFTITPAPATPTSSGSGGSGGGSGGNTSPATPPSPDINGDGKVTIIDASIVMAAINAPYNPRYDFDMNGSVGLDDLSILFSYMSH
ncbi:MAG: Dockerin type domain [Candidatus Parcubacteria bacterium]